MYIKINSHGNPEGYPITTENVNYLLMGQDHSLENLATLNLVSIKNFNSPEFNENHSEAIRGEIVKNQSGEIEQMWQVLELSVSEKVRRWVIGPRKSYLLRSDWTQVADSPLTAQEREKWRQYRAELRGITEIHDFANMKSREEINWPLVPTKTSAETKWADVPVDPPTTL